MIWLRPWTYSNRIVHLTNHTPQYWRTTCNSCYYFQEAYCVHIWLEMRNEAYKENELWQIFIVLLQPPQWRAQQVLWQPQPPSGAARRKLLTGMTVGPYHTVKIFIATSSSFKRFVIGFYFPFSYLPLTLSLFSMTSRHEYFAFLPMSSYKTFQMNSHKNGFPLRLVLTQWQKAIGKYNVIYVCS